MWALSRLSLLAVCMQTSLLYAGLSLLFLPGLSPFCLSLVLPQVALMPPGENAGYSLRASVWSPAERRGAGRAALGALAPDLAPTLDWTLSAWTRSGVGNKEGSPPAPRAETRPWPRTAWPRVYAGAAHLLF